MIIGSIMIDEVKNIDKWNWLRIASILVCGHFVVSSLIWLLYLILSIYWQIKGNNVIWTEFYGIMPPILLLSMTILCMKIPQEKIIVAKLLFVLIVIISSLLCYNDVHTESYQIQIATNEGCKHLYFTWWWFQF